LEALLAAALITYYVGAFASIFVYPRRAGLNRFAWLGAFMHPPSRRNGIPWAIKSFVKVMLWPLVFGWWLYEGKPPSPVLFGPEAAERLYGDREKHMPGFMTKWTERSRLQR
jgi:hypothetical protein